MKIYLVADLHTGLRSYDEKFKVFTDKNKALKWAEQNGYSDPFNLGVSERVGMASIGGDPHLIILPLELNN